MHVAALKTEQYLNNTITQQFCRVPNMTCWRLRPAWVIPRQIQEGCPCIFSLDEGRCTLLRSELRRPEPPIDTAFHDTVMSLPLTQKLLHALHAMDLDPPAASFGHNSRVGCRGPYG